MGELRTFIINEQRGHLAEKVGDILTALQSLKEDAPNLGNRQLLRAFEGIADQIRRIIKDHWPDTELPTLKTLQRIAVALMKAKDSNADTKEVIVSAVAELEQSVEDLGMPVNKLASPDSE